jgi:hypothetical protein
MTISPHKTRLQTRFRGGIRFTHPVAVKGSELLVHALRVHIGRQGKGIHFFLANLVRGDIELPNYGYVSRGTISSLLHKDKKLRGYVSNRWRQEVAHQHEWIPCTHLCDIASRAVVAEDFRYLLLADAMRTPTQSLIFKPVVGDPHQISASVDSHTPGSRPRFIVLQAHPGGLCFNRAPNTTFAYQGNRFAEGSYLSGYSQAFHDEIIRAITLMDCSSPKTMLDNIHNVFKKWCWNGKFPSGKPQKQDLWQYYTRGDGTEVNGLNFDQFCTNVHNEYNAINGEFENSWAAIATGRGRSIPHDWK